MFPHRHTFHGQKRKSDAITRFPCFPRSASPFYQLAQSIPLFPLASSLPAVVYCLQKLPVEAEPISPRDCKHFVSSIASSPVLVPVALFLDLARFGLMYRVPSIHVLVAVFPLSFHLPPR